MTQTRNPFEHHHDHGPDHDHDHDHGPDLELDPAQQSLADALRVSFMVLKIAMLFLVVAYVFSGFFSVSNSEVAMRLRYGRVVGEGAGRIIKPGNLHPAFPYPFEEVVKIPVSPRQIDLSREFWFSTTDAMTGKTLDEQAQGKSGPLDPEKDGSLLTGDANIIHARWSLSYRVVSPLDYAANVGSEAKADQLVRAAAEEGIVLAVAQHTADELIKGQFDREAVVEHVQKALDDVGSGIQVEPKVFSLSQAIIPLSVREAYEAVIRAESDKAQMIEQAHQDRSKTLDETAGKAHPELVEIIRQYEIAATADDTATRASLDSRLATVFDLREAPRWATTNDKLSKQTTDALWSNLAQIDAAQQAGDLTAQSAAQAKYDAALEELKVPSDLRVMIPITGKVAEAINDATSYRATAVAEVQRQAMIFQNWFNVYKNAPAVRGIVQGKLWQETKSQILGGDVETFYLPPGQSYLEINRDPDVSKRRTEAKLKAEQDARQAEQMKQAQGAR